MVDAQAIDATELVVCVRDRTGRYVLVNAAFEALTGLPRERLHGKRDAALNPQDIADKLAHHDTQVFETGAPSEVDEELLGRDGRVPVRSCRFAVVNDEGEPWAVCSVSASRDQVEKVRAERDRLAAIADGTPIPHSSVTSKRLDALVSDLVTAREAAAGLTEALEAERVAREEATGELQQLRVSAAEAEAGKQALEQALRNADEARAEAQAAAEAAAAAVRAAGAEAEARRSEADAAAAELERERIVVADLRRRIEQADAEKVKLAEHVKSLESQKRSSESGGLMHNMRLRHERSERQKAAARADQEAARARQLEARLAEISPERDRLEAALAALQQELETLRAEAAGTAAVLDEAQRDLERTRQELEAARAQLDEARRAPVHENVPVAAGVAASPTSTSLVWVQRRVADLVADAPSFESAMRSALAAFGELAGWDAVVGWLPARDGAFLRPANVWCSQAVAGSTFDVQSWQSILEDGPAAIATAWDNDEIVWIEDASDEERPRCGWARAAGLTTAVAVPVAVDGERHGLIEAYRREAGSRDEDVIAVLETIATQLGGLERMLGAGQRWR